jgi:hypothetical protein
MAEHIRGQIVRAVKNESRASQVEAENIADTVLELPRVKAGLALLDVQLTEIDIMRRFDLRSDRNG